MEPQKSNVYVKTDARGRILRCDGGYTVSNITDPENWVLIDSGSGDRYNLCQNGYFPRGLLTHDGIPRYKLNGLTPVLRTDAEIEADRDAIPEPGPSDEDRIEELERALSVLLTGMEAPA